jgi:hypothetical protein
MHFCIVTVMVFSTMCHTGFELRISYSLLNKGFILFGFLRYTMDDISKDIVKANVALSAKDGKSVNKQAPTIAKKWVGNFESAKRSTLLKVFLILKILISEISRISTFTREEELSMSTYLRLHGREN